jgi:HAD superfamily hydrolase (TIGR01509 family)
MMLPEAILLDYDGVVVHSEPLYEKVELRQFARYGIQPSPEDWGQFKGISANAFFELVKEKYLPDADISQLMAEWKADLLKEFKHGLQFVNGLEDFLEIVRGKSKLAIVTSTSREMIDWIGNNTQCLPMVDLLITADDVKHTKPHPEPFLRAAEMLNVNPARCLVIEDSVHGIRSGLAAGAKVLAFSTSLPRDFLREAHAIVKNFRDVDEKLLHQIMETIK